LSWLIGAGLAAATFGGNPVTSLGLHLAFARGHRDNRESAPEKEKKKPQKPLPATVWIGIVERFGFTLALLIGLPTVAAILLGVKALGQYVVKNNSGPVRV